MKALVGAFNQEKALVGAFSVIVKTGCETDGSIYSTNFDICNRHHLIIPDVLVECLHHDTVSVVGMAEVTRGVQGRRQSSLQRISRYL